MSDQPTLPRSLLRRAENTELSLGSLEAISEIRAYLDELEKLAIASAREKGATVEDIADSLKLTPQAIYYRFRHEKTNGETTPGEPDLPEASLAPEVALTPEAVLAPTVPTTPVEDPVLAPDTLPG